MVDAKGWCERALASVSSLWDANTHHAWRTSESMQPLIQQGYYPTATFHAIAAFGECGVWDDAEYRVDKKTLRTTYLEVNNFSNYSTYSNVLRTMVQPGQGWVDARVQASSHSLKAGEKQTGKDQDFWPRQSLVIGRLLHALRLLVKSALHDKARLNKLSGSDNDAKLKALEQLLANINGELNIAAERLYEVVGKKDIIPKTRASEDADEIAAKLSSDLSANPNVSPYVLLQVALGFVDHKRISTMLEPTKSAIPSTIADDDPSSLTKKGIPTQQYLSAMRQYFAGEIHRLMSHRHVPSSPDYDSASLVFSLHGRLLVDPTFRFEPLFRACVEAVVADQLPDGSWPDGRSATFDDHGTAIQQPSVAIALSLADCIFRRQLLISGTPAEMDLLNIGLTALRKMGRNLEASFNEECGKNLKCSGWVSDRVRWPNVSETWITAMAARFFHLLWLTERACARYERLSKYGVYPHPLPQSSTEGAIDFAAVEHPVLDISTDWQEKVIEPDTHATPAGKLLEAVLLPVQIQQKQGSCFLRPKKNAVSFIIFGPPGSGKTYFVKMFAEVLGWPLLILNPGHFIRKGLEFIEATSAEIFNDLMHLDHAVVFFDECDELFRDRSNQSQTRNILSFATASMLPKLQDLHDARRVVFFLGTNYLSNIDTAIRREGRFDDTLFFDRPDETARKLAIEKEWRETHVSDPSKYPEPLADAVAKTTGWSISDVIGYAKAKASGESPATPHLSDYINWCTEELDKDRNDKPNELNSSRLSELKRSAIRARWEGVIAFCQKKDTEQIKDV